MNVKKIITSVITIIVILALTAAGMYFIKKTSSAGIMGKGGWGGWKGGASATITSVRTITAQNVTLHDYVNTNGDVETQTAIEVFPSIGGRVVQVDVSLGSPIKAGQVIAYIDPSEPGNYYAKSPVIAPISGSILSSSIRVGSKVTTGSVIAKIGDIENLQITAKVPERYVGDLKLGLKANVVLEAYPDAVFPATVVRISPVLDSSSRTKEIILHFDTNDSRINAGMFAKIKLFTVDYKNHIAVQQDAIVNNNDKYYLYVVNPDGETVSKRQVTLGKNVDGYYQILTGVELGESVVVEGMLTLTDGGKIKDVDKAAAQKAAEGDGKASRGGKSE